MQLQSILATRERAAGALIDLQRSVGYFEIRRMGGYGMPAIAERTCLERPAAIPGSCLSLLELGGLAFLLSTRRGQSWWRSQNLPIAY